MTVDADVGVPSFIRLKRTFPAPGLIVDDTTPKKALFDASAAIRALQRRPLTSIPILVFTSARVQWFLSIASRTLHSTQPQRFPSSRAVAER